MTIYTTKTTTNHTGISLLGAFGLLFVGLKLTGFITWSWWWVTAPFWAPAAAFLALLLLGLLFTGLGHADATVRQVFRAAFLITVALVLMLVLGLLSGCGGGGDDESPDQPTPRVDCAKEPKLCH